MRNLLVLLVVLVEPFCAVCYWRGWFSVPRERLVEVHTHPAQIKQDEALFSNRSNENDTLQKEEPALPTVTVGPPWYPAGTAENRLGQNAILGVRVDFPHGTPEPIFQGSDRPVLKSFDGLEAVLPP